ncbi:hypothetical protein MRX96_007527 [Rhipicephalus microplus]
MPATAESHISRRQWPPPSGVGIEGTAKNKIKGGVNRGEGRRRPSLEKGANDDGGGSSGRTFFTLDGCDECIPRDHPSWRSGFGPVRALVPGCAAAKLLGPSRAGGGPAICHPRGAPNNERAARQRRGTADDNAGV